MGYTTSAYHFYGIRIPEDQWTEAYAALEGERLDSMIHDVNKIAELNGHSVRLGTLTAGQYDQHMLFVGVRGGLSWEVNLGTYQYVRVFGSVPDEWDVMLKLLAAFAKYNGNTIHAPGWITVPSVD